MDIKQAEGPKKTAVSRVVVCGCEVFYACFVLVTWFADFVCFFHVCFVALLTLL